MSRPLGPRIVRRMVVAAALALPLAGAARPEPGTEGGIAGSAWSGPATLSAKIQFFGSVSGPASFVLEFGPAPFLGPDEFSLFVDDGVDSLTIEGTYLEADPGKVELFPSASSYEAAWCELFFEMGVDDCAFDTSAFKAKAKVKSTAEGDAIKLKFSAKSDVTLELGGEIGTASLKFGLKKATGARL